MLPGDKTSSLSSLMSSCFPFYGHTSGTDAILFGVFMCLGTDHLIFRGGRGLGFFF